VWARYHNFRSTGKDFSLLIEFGFRFLIGAIVVSVFAVLSDLFSPKSFAGLFAAAPSIGLATLSLAVADQGVGYASVEARSMMLGALALLVYSQATAYVVMRYKWRSLPVSVVTMVLWFGVAFGLRFLFLS
jgi:uncharacterized protein DUF3147